MTLEEWENSDFRKIIVTGGKDYNNMSLVWSVLSNYNVGYIIQGGSAGADKLALDYAKDYCVFWKTYKPNWVKYGDIAVSIRNEIMCKENQDALVIAFPENKNTRSCLIEAESLKMLIIRIKDCLTNS